MFFDSFFLKKISTSVSLLIISFLSFLVGYWAISQAQKLEKLQQPVPFYVSRFATSTLWDIY